MGQRDQLHDESSTKAVECGDCDWKGQEKDLLAVEHLTQRVSPGEIMPVGECPVCGALAHYADPLPRPI